MKSRYLKEQGYRVKEDFAEDALALLDQICDGADAVQKNGSTSQCQNLMDSIRRYQNEFGGLFQERFNRCRREVESACGDGDFAEDALAMRDNICDSADSAMRNPTPENCQRVRNLVSEYHTEFGDLFSDDVERCANQARSACGPGGTTR